MNALCVLVQVHFEITPDKAMMTAHKKEKKLQKQQQQQQQQHQPESEPEQLQQAREKTSKFQPVIFECNPTNYPNHREQPSTQQQQARETPSKFVPITIVRTRPSQSPSPSSSSSSSSAYPTSILATSQEIEENHQPLSQQQFMQNFLSGDLQELDFDQRLRVIASISAANVANRQRQLDQQQRQLDHQ
jgi:hypothetical protein